MKRDRNLLADWSRLTPTDSLIAQGGVLRRGSIFAGPSYLRCNSPEAKKAMGLMPYKPRDSKDFEVAQVFKHHIGYFSNPTMNGHSQLEAHCTCGWMLKAVKWREETEAQHKRRFKRRLERHIEQVLEHEHSEERKAKL